MELPNPEKAKTIVRESTSISSILSRTPERKIESRQDTSGFASPYNFKTPDQSRAAAPNIQSVRKRPTKASKFNTPAPLAQRRNLVNPILIACNNPLLNKKSEVFESDIYLTCERRCVFSLQSENTETTAGLHVEISVNALSDP